MREENFVPLGERAGEEIVVGAIGQFWADRYVRLRGASDFRAFRDPRFARIALNVWVPGDEKGGSLVSTATRVLCPDPQASRKSKAAGGCGRRADLPGSHAVAQRSAAPRRRGAQVMLVASPRATPLTWLTDPLLSRPAMPSHNSLSSPRNLCIPAA